MQILECNDKATQHICFTDLVHVNNLRNIFVHFLPNYFFVCKLYLTKIFNLGKIL